MPKKYIDPTKIGSVTKIPKGENIMKLGKPIKLTDEKIAELFDENIRLKKELDDYKNIIDLLISLNEPLSPREEKLLVYAKKIKRTKLKEKTK